MSRDYARSAPQPRKRPPRNRVVSRPVSPWTIFAGGLGAGLAIALVGLLLWHWQSTEEPAAPVADSDEVSTAADPVKPRFEFYTLLKESEVFVPQVEEPQSAAAPATEKPEAEEKDSPERGGDQSAEAAVEPSKPAPTPDKATYEILLQVGSFRSRGDADSLRAQLLLLGLGAGIESAGSGSGEVWHRVMIGPFESPAALAQARARLQANGIDHIPVQRRQP